MPGCVPPSAEARRANLAVSAIKKQVHSCVPVFYNVMRDSKRAMRSIETVRGTVSVPGCVPPSAEARRANLAVSASVVTDYVSFVTTFCKGSDAAEMPKTSFSCGLHKQSLCHFCDTGFFHLRDSDGQCAAVCYTIK